MVVIYTSTKQSVPIITNIVHGHVFTACVVMHVKHTLKFLGAFPF